MSKLKVAQNLIDLFYPIGTFYETSNLNFDPNKEWGGIWNCTDTSGRVTVNIGNSDYCKTIMQYGGSIYLQSHTHTGTVDPNGSHTHNMLTSVWFSSEGIWDDGTIHGTYNSTTHGVQRNVNYGGHHDHSFTTNSTGNGNSENLQPYVVVKRWHRTA